MRPPAAWHRYNATQDRHLTHLFQDGAFLGGGGGEGDLDLPAVVRFGRGDGDRESERGGGALPGPFEEPPRAPAGGGEGLLPLEAKRGGGDMEGERCFGA